METFLKNIVELLTKLVNHFIKSEGKTKYQTVTVIKAAATPVGTYTDSEQLDTNFQYCDGVQVIEETTGGIAFYSVGLEDKNNLYHNIVHKKDWQSGSDTPINQRYKDIFIPIISGEKIDVKTNLPAIPASEVKYHIIFRLRKK